jgi:hypothetical protein
MPKKGTHHSRSLSQTRAPLLLRDPRVSTGDVILLIQRETWPDSISKLNCAMGAALLVLAATARIGPKAARNIMLADWENGNVFVQTLRGERAPLIMPVAEEVVKRYISLRPANAGPWLFVSGKGSQFWRNYLNHAFIALGRQCGIPGRSLLVRCLQYFDRSFDGEDDDRAAVVALSGWRNSAVDAEVRWGDVDAAARDPDRLLAVLEDNHDLTGPAVQFLGARGMALAEETRTLFITQDYVPRVFSPAMLTDPVCISLRGITWPAKGKKAFRTVLKLQHFDHLDDLRTAGLISQRETAYLFSCAPRTVSAWRKKRAAAQKTATEIEEEMRWRDEAPQMYLDRRRGEKPKQFHERLVADHDCKLAFLHVFNILKMADVLKPRPRAKITSAEPSPRK